jgi:16S rRNA G966 N2-methylase RsmD
MISKEQIHLLKSEEVQQFIRENEYIDEKKLVLNHRQTARISTSILAEQIIGRRKAREKLPQFYSTTGIVYPPVINLEQCSSEITALYKTEVITGHLGKDQLTACADLTGGLGIDSLYWSKIFKKVVYVEPDETLLTIARHNHDLLNARNIQYLTETAESFLAHNKARFNLIFIDPSRRSSHNKKVFRLSDCSPNVVQLSSQLLAQAGLLMIKASPLLDLHQAMAELNHIVAIHIVSVNNECKEVLFLRGLYLNREPVVVTVNLSNYMRQKFTFTFREERESSSSFSGPATYIYEPNASIMKGGAFKTIGNRFHLHKLHANTHLYTSADCVSEFPGRIFRLFQDIKPDRKTVAPYFPERKANVITRNYPVTAVELKKKCGLADGGDHYLIGCTSVAGKHVFVAERIQ